MLGLSLEIFALLSPVKGDTLSEHIWSLRGTGYFSLIIFLLFWLIFHFLAEGQQASHDRKLENQSGNVRIRHH